VSPDPRRARAAGRPGRSLVRLGTVACLVATLAGCAVGPSQRPPVAVHGTDMPAPPASAAPRAPGSLPDPEPLHTSIAFTDCTGDTLAALGDPQPVAGPLAIRCGEIDVPRDPQEPAAGRSRLGIVRVGAADAPPDRPPLLVVGDSDTDPSARHAALLATQVSPGLLEHYQLIGIDRRGSGSDLLDCAPTDARIALVDGDPGPSTDAGLSATLENARSVVQDCYLSESSGIAGYSSNTTAADVEQLRGRLGVNRLSALGVGDGAAALTIWAATHPGSVGRLVLDGPPDPTAGEPERTEGRAGAAEQTFDAFATACTASPACPLGPDPRATVTALVQRLRTAPVAAADGRRLTAGVAVNALLAGLAEPKGWPQLATALADAGRGVPEGLLALLYPVLGEDGRFDSALATACNDTSRRLTPPEVGALVGRWRGVYPLFGGTLAQRLLACAPWPAGPGAAVPGPAPDAPPILVLGTAHDPRTSAEGARRAAAALATARFVRWQGSGTGSYPRTACVTAAVDQMLVDAVMPQADTLCPP
jgi:pimeloyl-ACP methyl ester carboxylesterase